MGSFGIICAAAVAVEMVGGSGRVFRRVPLARLLCTRSVSTKLFIGGLSYDTNETILKDAFVHYGEIIEVRVICDHMSGKSKGYGFVRFSCETASERALKEMDGQVLDGRNIRVHYARHA